MFVLVDVADDLKPVGVYQAPVQEVPVKVLLAAGSLDLVVELVLVVQIEPADIPEDRGPDGHIDIVLTGLAVPVGTGGGPATGCHGEDVPGVDFVVLLIVRAGGPADLDLV